MGWRMLLQTGRKQTRTKLAREDRDEFASYCSSRL